MVDADLLAAFLSEGTSTVVSPTDAEVHAGLRSILEQARTHGLPENDERAFVAYLGQRCETDEVVAFLERVDAEAATLAYACRDGDDTALRRFEATYFREVEVGASRLRCSTDELDEIRQATREALFGAGPGGRPKVLEMTARGDLRALIRLIALRAGISRRRKQGLHATDGDDAVLARSRISGPPHRWRWSRPSIASASLPRFRLRSLGWMRSRERCCGCTSSMGSTNRHWRECTGSIALPLLRG